MAVLMMFVFVLVMTIAAFWPSDGKEEATDHLYRKGETASAMLQAYHGGASRFCYSTKPPCDEGVVLPANVRAQSASFYATPAGSYANSFVSFSNGPFLFTYFVGTGNPGLANEEMQMALEGLVRDAPAGSQSNAGYWDGTARAYRPKGGSIYVFGGTTAPGPQESIQAVPEKYGLRVPDGAPMLVTQLRAVSTVP